MRWLASLPSRYQDIRGDKASLLSSPDGGALLRLNAGDVALFQGPGVTHTPMAMLHATISPGAKLSLPWRADFTALAYVLNGNGTVGPEAGTHHSGPVVQLGVQRRPVKAEVASFESRQDRE